MHNNFSYCSAAAVEPAAVALSEVAQAAVALVEVAQAVAVALLVAALPNAVASIPLV